MKSRLVKYALIALTAVALSSGTTLAQGGSAIQPGQNASTISARDDGPKSDSPGSGSSKKSEDRPAAKDSSGLTERERVLLDRIDQLEKRLADVEALVAKKPASDAGQPTAERLAAEKPVAPSAASPANTAAASTAMTPAASLADSAKASQEQAKAAAAQVGPQKPEKKEPFAFADFTWLTGNSREKTPPVDTPFFTPEVRVDVNYTSSFNHPKDDTIGGSSEIFRSGEFQLTQLGVGGDFHWNNVRGRLMTQFGMYSETTPRNDASPGRGQWNLDSAYRYISEAYGGYHIDKLNGINIDAGIFMSYVGLFSYYQYDNWAYQPSYVSSNTPWFFEGMRIQIFPSDKLKIEPWLINGWQSYGKFNRAPGIGGQILWRPNGSISILANNYWGTDALGIPGRKRLHTDDSVQLKWLDRPNSILSKAASTLTIDAGCEYGVNSGVSCHGKPGAPAQYFLGFMQYDRFWFHHDLYAITIGG
ncbi:MAG TPA: outer membrane beta-barrel protein, partial [Blastocatellia bacterium]|nr:outer membrane beta-barrel protein [Blastocatellia bacterium]